MKKYKTGVVIGRFEPPHYGHCYMIDFAATFCEKLHVLVYTLKEESIPGEVRFKALMDHYRPDVSNSSDLKHNIKIHWIEKPMPQQPEEHWDFWNIWRDDIKLQIGEKIDCIFGSEPYVETLGKYIECDSKIVDSKREVVPISGTMCRNNFNMNWDYIIPEMRHYFLKRICFLGGESTGKSTIARMMAKVFQTQYVEEYARYYCTFKNPKNFLTHDFHVIAANQERKEKEASKVANRFLFCDTDAITTQCFHKLYLGNYDKGLERFIEQNKHDLYFLLAPVIEFDQDGTRDFPDARQEQFEMLKSELEKRGKEFVIIDEPDFAIRINLIKFEIEKRFCK